MKDSAPRKRGAPLAKSSGNKKRRAASEDETSTGSEPSDAFPSSQEEEDNESIEEGEQQVDFDFCDPEESDFHIIKAMVHRYLDGAEFDSSELADNLIEKVQVSSCLRSGDECIGVAAILPMQHFKALKSMQQALAHWRSKASKDARAALKAAMADEHCGVLLSERVLNAPPQLAPPLMASLQRDLEACKGHSDDELHVYGALKHLLLCARAYEDTGVAAHHAGAVTVSDRATASKQAASQSATGEMVFVRPEDECMYKYAEWSCSWAVPTTGDFEQNVKSMRVLMLVSTANMRKSIKDLAKLFDHDIRQHGLK